MRFVVLKVEGVEVVGALGWVLLRSVVYRERCLYRLGGFGF